MQKKSANESVWQYKSQQGELLMYLEYKKLERNNHETEYRKARTSEYERVEIVVTYDTCRDKNNQGNGKM